VIGIKRRFLALAVSTLIAIVLLTAGELYLANIAFHNRELNRNQVEADRITHNLLRAILETIQARDLPPRLPGGKPKGGDS
jgi:hypothetical protein